ncbi:MAG: hypothetical protein KDI71_11160 [Xanthomonadales bacterium]|nr:hypothetical protein [Xanthomonadales bacterium]
MRLLGMLFLWLVVGIPAHGQSAKPADLQAWSDWVMKDAEFTVCPVRYNVQTSNERDHFCRVPGTLQLQLDADRGRFQISWQVIAAGYVGLPGSEDAWPVAVTVDGQPTAVMVGDRGPQVWLEPGFRRMAGELSWAQRPQSLALPEGVARLEVTLDGQQLAAPELRRSRLWLGNAEVVASEADALRVEVYRRLRDDLPLTLSTWINLSVSGKARELVLGPILPAGFVGSEVNGSLTSRLESDGRLRVQLTPGSHWLEIGARALEAADSVNRGPKPAENWPEQEVWSFSPGAVRGPVDASGGEPVDPATAGVPEQWQSLPAYLLLPDQVLSIDRPPLSLEAIAANHLSLERQLWLDFDASGWTAIDNLGGQMNQGWRLDALAELDLQRANSGGEALLLTASTLHPDAVGVEWRAKSVSLQATARLPGGASLPVSGWSEVVDQANLTVNLPPGYQLLAAPGADRANSAWISRWRLGDVFLLCLGGLMAWRLGGGVLAAVTVGYLLLSFDHAKAPMMSVLMILLVLLLARWAEGYRIGIWLRRFAYLAALALAWVALPYAASQLSLALHPQLERYSVASSGGFNQATSQVIGGSYAGRGRHYDNYSPVQEEGFDAPAALAEPAPQESGVVMSDDQELDQVTVTGSRVQSVRPAAPPVKMAKQQVLNRLDPKAVVQAGSAEPQW